MVLNTHFIWGYTSIGKIYLALTIFLLIMILQCALIMAVIFVFLRGEYFLRNREFPFLPFFDWRRGQTRYKISIIFPVAQKTVNMCPKWIPDIFCEIEIDSAKFNRHTFTWQQSSKGKNPIFYSWFFTPSSVKKW